MSQERFQPDPAAMGANPAADYLGVSPSTVWRLVRAKKLRTTKVGHRTLILKNSLDKLLADGLVDSEAA